MPDGRKTLCRGAELVSRLAREKGGTNASGVQVPTPAYVSTIQESKRVLLNNLAAT